MVIWQQHQTYNIKTYSMLCSNQRWKKSALPWSSLWFFPCTSFAYDQQANRDWAQKTDFGGLDW